jgi:ankyrin repeat protein
MDTVERVVPLESAAPQRRAQITRWELFERENPLSARPENQIHVKFGLGTQLLSAAALGEVEDLKDLLAQGADVNTTNADGLTPLHQVCIDHRVDLAEILLAAGLC